MLSGRCQDFKGITFLFRFGHAVCLTAIPFLMACCDSQHSLGHAGRMAWTSWIINMVFRAVVMETQAVSHIWIIRIRHILSITFNQKRWLTPKDKSIFSNSPSTMKWIWVCLFICFEACETNPCFIIHYFYIFVFELLNWFPSLYIWILCLVEMFSHASFCFHTFCSSVHDHRLLLFY